MTEISDRAKGHWKTLLPLLGVDAKYLDGKNGPCPVCQGKDRFRFTNYMNMGMWWCNQCGTGDGFELLQQFHGWDFKTTAKEVEKMLPNMPESKAIDPDAKIKMARDGLNKFKKGVEKASENAEAKRYLEGRGLVASPLLLAHSAAEYWDGKVWAGNFAAMVGLVSAPDGRPLTYHRTFLADGKKAAVPSPRKIMPAAGDTTGSAIRLWPVSASIGIAEGIETALACHQLFGIPTWAAISSGGLERLIPPEGIQELTIFADRDASYTGQAAAFALAKRLVQHTDIRVCVSLPDNMGDFNDQLLASLRNKGKV